MSGGFMGGLAQGIATGVQLDNQRGYLDLQKQYADRQTHADARDAELHNAKMDEFRRVRAANDEVASFLSGGNQTAQQPQSGLAPSTGQQLVSDTRAPGLSMVSDQQPVSDTRAPGLSDVSTPAAPQARQMPAGQIIAKNMLTGNVLNDPDKMTAIANIYGKHGLTDKMVPWLTQAYQAKKSGIVDALPYLMASDGENAAAMLKKGGIDIQGTPTLVDKQNQVWSFNIGGQPREIGMRQIIGMADPENWLKTEHDRELKASQINSHNANAYESRAKGDYYLGAKSNESMARAERYGRIGMGGTSQDKPEKIDAAIKRRDSTLDALSSTTGDDGKPFVDPQKRMIYSGLAVDAEQALTDSLGRDLTAREQHKLTDMLRTAPLGNSEGMAQWGAQLERAFGIKPAPSTQPPVSTPAASASTTPAQPTVQPNPSSLGGQVLPPAPTKIGGLQALQAQQQLRDEMNAVKQALMNPNLTPQQKQALALQANDIQNRTDAYYKGR